MSETDKDPDSFDDQMQSLALEAEKKRPDAAKEPGKVDWFLRMAQLMKPVALGIESLTRASSEQSMQLQKLTQTLATNTERLNLVEDLHADFNKNAEVAAANQRLFDAMHEEMRGYKDSFLFDTMQKPFIKDVLVVFDELQTILIQTREQAQGLSAEGNSRAAELETVANNVENNIHLLVEVLIRMDVTQMEAPASTLDKKMHRVVGFDDVEAAEEDGQIARSVRTGFIWRDRVIRPEEVILKRCRMAEESQT